MPMRSAATSAPSAIDFERFHHPDTPQRASLVARIEGSDPDAPTVAFMGHTDVVPVSEDSWTRDPFGAELVDGPAGMEVWGRGAVDMLNQTAAMAVAMRRLASRASAQHGTLLYLAVADEEAGSMQGVAASARRASRRRARRLRADRGRRHRQ